MPISLPANVEERAEPHDVVDRFLRCTEAFPDRPAISLNGNITGYAALRRRAASFAHEFAKIDSPRVLIALGQEVDAYSAIFAASWAGGYHTPLNIKAPTEKLARIARVLQPDFIVANGELGRSLAREAPDARLVDPQGLLDAADFLAQRPRHHLAYIIFTSGSTGTPKGVMVPRHALDHYVSSIEGTLNVRPGDRVAQHANLGFDMSVVDIFGALCFGATLCPMANEGDRLIPARMIAREQITIWTSVPSVIGLMMQARQATAKYLQTVRLFNFCGEPLLPEHLDAIFSAVPRAEVLNTYGPTEATVFMTAVRMNADNYLQYCGVSVALGNPIPGMAIHLCGGRHVDEGEIVIEGPQLADGYWQDGEMTAAAFRDLIDGGQRKKVYFTGDWAERRAGNLYFKERIDFQVKISGYRIELDEVAAAIRACGWPVACVFKRGESLAAVVERQEGMEFHEASLRAALREKIERYAIPQTIRVIDRMPRNENEKMDRKAVEAWFSKQN